MNCFVRFLGAALLLFQTAAFGAPANDAFAKAQLLTGLDGNFTGTTVGATVERGEYVANPSNPIVASVWFQWKAPADGYLELEYYLQEYDIDFNLVSEIQIDASISRSAKQHDPLPGWYSGLKVAYEVKAGDTVRIRATSTSGLEAPFTVPFRFATSAVMPKYPLRIKESAGSVEVEIRRLGSSQGFINGQFRTFVGTDPFVGFDGAPTTATEGEDYTAAQIPITFAPGEISKTVTIVLPAQGNSLEGEERVDIEIANLTGAVLLGEGYPGRQFFHLDDEQDDPANDNFADAENLGGTSGTRSANIGISGREAGDPGDEFSVWYTWTAPADGVLQLDLDDLFYSTRVFTGGTLAQLTPVSSSKPGGSTRFEAVSGTTYRIAIVGNLDPNDGYYATSFNITLDYGFVAGPVVQFESALYVVQEKAGTISIPVIRLGDVTGTTTVSFATDDTVDLSSYSFNPALANLSDGLILSTDGSVDPIPRRAEATQDYLSNIGQVIFAAGERRKNVIIPIVSDRKKEKTEFFGARISNASGSAEIGNPDVVPVAITENGIFTAANYYGAVEHVEKAYARRGTIAVKLGAAGAFSGKVQWGASTVPFSGAFDSSDAELTLEIGGNKLPALKLKLKAPTLSDRSDSFSPIFIRGTVAEPSLPIGVEASTFSAARARTSADAGSFNVSLNPSGTPAAAPTGHGFANLKIKPTNAAVLSGMLADGTKFSASGPVSFWGRAEDHFAFDAVAYAKKGGIAGRITNLNHSSFDYSGATFGDGDGEFSWGHPALTKGPVQSEFSTTLGSIISVHRLPKGVLPLVPGDYDLAVKDQAGATLLTRIVTISATGALSTTAGTEAVRLSMSKTTGVLTGSFKQGTDNAKIFGLALRNVQNATGFFVTPSAVGSFELTPRD